MGSSSSGSSSLIRNSGSEEDERKRKRMISNRESARRSRMRKQKHLEDLTAQEGQLKKENHQILSNITITTQHYLNLEAENSVMRAQASELSHRLESLNEIIGFLDGATPELEPEPAYSFMNPLHMGGQQPIMVSADIFHY